MRGKAWLGVATLTALVAATPVLAHEAAPSMKVEWVDPESAEAQGSARNMVAVGPRRPRRPRIQR